MLIGPRGGSPAAGGSASMSAMSWCFWPKDRNTHFSPRAVTCMSSTSSYQAAVANGSCTYSARWVRRMRGFSSWVWVIGGSGSVDRLGVGLDRRLHRGPGHGGDFAELAPLLEPGAPAVE